MNKRIFLNLLMAVLLLGLSQSVISCKDDDDEKSEEQKEQEAQQTYDAFWDVVGQLTGSVNYTSDYEDKTFEPGIGQPSESNPYVRLVNTGDMATAAQRFASLVGVSSINENTTEYEWKDDNVGTLTYHKSTDGQSLATVDVSIKQMPHLQRIIYCTTEQMGTNGNFDGNAYYRFGDVVKREYSDKKNNNKQMTEYWVCVRPACGPAGKSTSHWITLSPLPKENLFEHNGSNGFHYAVPTGISTNTEHMQNLAELTYAILHPHEWGQNLTSNERTPHPKMWHDFKPERYQYNNEYYFDRVQRDWNELGIFSMVFGMNDIQLNEQIAQNGLNLLAKGYSWWTKFSWNLTLYQHKYTNGTGAEANMHCHDFTEVKKDVQAIKNLDLTAQYAKGYNYLQSAEMFGDNGPRYVIRHATGKDLYGVDPDVYVSIAVDKGDVKLTDIYVYNKKHEIYIGNFGQADITPATSQLAAPEVGCIVGKDGNFYPDLKSATEYGTEGIAMVTYLGGNKRVEKGKDFNALAIALADVNLTESSTTANASWSSNDAERTFCSSQVTSPEEYANLLDGIAQTAQLAKDGHGHPAAENTTKWKPELVNALPADKFSKWFMPSVGQWILTFKGTGYTVNGSKIDYATHLQDLMKKATGKNDNDLSSLYLTTTESSVDSVYLIETSNISNIITIHNYPKKDKAARIRAMLAFKYGNGGTEDPADVHPFISYPAKRGYVLTADGYFYPNKAKAESFNQQVIGIVACLMPAGGVDNTNRLYTGLAIASEPIANRTWANFEHAKDETFSTVAKDLKAGLPIVDGLQQTEKLVTLEQNNEAMFFEAARACWNKTDISNPKVRDNFSKWFLPSLGQWEMVFRGFGLSEEKILNMLGDGNAYVKETFINLYKDAGLREPDDNTLYWSSTTQSNGKIWAYSFNAGFYYFSCDTDIFTTLPFMAFKVKD